MRTVIMGFLLALGASCTVQAIEPLQVVSSIAPVNLLVTALAGTEVQAHTLLSATADPHEVSLRLSDRKLLDKADLVIWIGPNLERYLIKALPSSRTLEIGQLPGLAWPVGREGKDMHLWLSPANAKIIARAIAASLSTRLPASAPLIQQRLDALLARIDNVAAQIKTRLAPVQSVPFGVGHDGYGHWVNYWGLNQVAALSVLPEQHLGAKHLIEVQQKLIGARCVVTDFSEGNQQKLHELLQLPVFVADPLAQSRSYADYGEFLLALADVFSNCLGQPG
jgi:zinc transport system substrate-binding protein